MKKVLITNQFNKIENYTDMEKVIGTEFYSLETSKEETMKRIEELGITREKADNSINFLDKIELFKGFKKIKDYEEKKKCNDLYHTPPTMIVLQPGFYEHTCPSCGNCIRVNVPLNSTL